MLDTELTSRIQKGGALLGDMRQLVSQWDRKPEGIASGRFVRDVLPKATYARAQDTYTRVFEPRFIAGSPPVAWKLCARIEEFLPANDIARAFYYWITARAEPILYRYVTEELFDQARSGIQSVTSNDVALWIRKITETGGKQWADVVNIKVARAMLAALRDFGVLEGAAKKTISGGHLPLESFCLIAFCLRCIMNDSQEPTAHPDWRLFLLFPKAVERLFLEAHQHDFLHYQAAGAVCRLEFPTETFDDYVRLVLDR
jgi:hypothetical protein